MFSVSLSFGESVLRLRARILEAVGLSGSLCSVF